MLQRHCKENLFLLVGMYGKNNENLIHSDDERQIKSIVSFCSPAHGERFSSRYLFTFRKKTFFIGLVLNDSKGLNNVVINQSYFASSVVKKSFITLVAHLCFSQYWVSIADRSSIFSKKVSWMYLGN